MLKLIALCVLITCVLANNNETERDDGSPRTLLPHYHGNPNLCRCTPWNECRGIKHQTIKCPGSFANVFCCPGATQYGFGISGIGISVIPTKNQCKCMHWRHCLGLIDSDVQCQPSHSKVCCVEPDTGRIDFL